MKPGTLYIVATPIGNLSDISQRAQQILAQVDVIAAEDTRHSGKLLQKLNINKPLKSYFDHNEDKVFAHFITLLQHGQNVALISDGGTPLISDPGYRLVAAAAEKGLPIVAIPGPSSVIGALSIAGLPTDRFVFEGFIPSKPATRRKFLQQLANESRTLVLFETPHRLAASLLDCRDSFGSERQAVVVRELTKMYESVYRGSLSQLADEFNAHPSQCRGEIVLLIHGAEPTSSSLIEGLRVAQLLADELPLSKAANLAAKITGCDRKTIYQQLVNNKPDDN